MTKARVGEDLRVWELRRSEVEKRVKLGNGRKERDEGLRSKEEVVEFEKGKQVVSRKVVEE